MTEDALAAVIRESPVEVDPRLFQMVRLVQGETYSPATVPHFSMIDSEEATLVTVQGAEHEIPVEGAYRDLRLIRLRVSKPFAAPGFLNAAATAIASRHHPVLIVSTFSVDYILVRASVLGDCLSALAAAGFPVPKDLM